MVGIGGKGVGKSTMLKYISNQLIQNIGPIIWIDLDPGQAEFTLPGCLSCTILRNPILGPNFTHLDQEVIKQVYLGTVNVSEVMQRYHHAVEYLVNFLKADSNLVSMPWVVNTMGFNRGLGVTLLKKSLKLINPTNLVEVRSRFAKKNYECNFRDYASQNLPNCNVMSFEAVPESMNVEMGVQDNWGIPEPYKLRDIVILSYIEERNLMNHPVFSVPIQALNIQFLNFADKKPISTELALNTALVSLGNVVDKENVRILPNQLIIDSLGFGAIVGINHEKRLLYLKTSLSEDELSSINCVTCGSIQLPHGYFKSKGKNGDPYVQAKQDLETPLNVPWQKSGKPRLTEFQQK